MSSSNFYKDLLEHGNEDSDISDVGPEDMANMIKGVEDMDDALFGFKAKQQDSQKSKPAPGENVSERPTPNINQPSKVSDFPEGDLLADISLSDDDFFDLGKKPASDSKNLNKMRTTPEKVNQDKLAKSKKIANLFGLDDGDDVETDSKKKQQGAADWLGIKESPVKSATVHLADDKTIIQSRKNSALTISDREAPVEEKGLVGTKRDESMGTLAKGISSKETTQLDITVAKTKISTNRNEPAKGRGTKTIEVFDLLGDKPEPKAAELKEKKSAILDELFGDSGVARSNISRRNSAEKSKEIFNTEVTVTVPPPVDNSAERSGQYTPSSGAARRPGLGRRRGPATPPASLLFQEDWSLNQEKAKKEILPINKTDVKSSATEVNKTDGLPTWLGGSYTLPDTKPTVTPSTNVVTEKPAEKTVLVEQVPVPAAALELEHNSVDQSNQKSVEEVMAQSAEESQRTKLALQRMEAQLFASVGLQSVQNDLAAVCTRQHRLLDSQERQLAQLVARQTERQGQLERQLLEQQGRIQKLLETLSTNMLLPTSDTEARSLLFKEEELKEKEQSMQNNLQIVSDLKDEIQKSTLQNEGLRMKIELLETYHKMELESLLIQHRREIESWEDQLNKQKELIVQVKNEYSGIITRLKENEAELINEHSERVRRLREEQGEDMKQLIQFHKLTLEHLAYLAKPATPSSREENITLNQTWKPLDDSQISEIEKELRRKEKALTALQEKLVKQKELSEKQLEEIEAQLEQEKMKNEDFSRQLKQEQTQLKYKQQQLNQEKKYIEEQYYVQRKYLEEMKEKVMSEQTQLATEKLSLAEERAKLDVLAKLQGVSGTVSFDMIQAKAELHAALEAARAAEIQTVEERLRLKEKERTLDTQRWKLREIEEELASKSEYFHRVIQAAQASREESLKALEEAKHSEQRADDKLLEVERRKKEILEKEQSLVRFKLEMAHEEMRLNRKRQQLEHILPQLSSDEALSLYPVKGDNVIDPKMLVMKLRAERDLKATQRCEGQS